MTCRESYCCLCFEAHSLKNMLKTEFWPSEIGRLFLRSAVCFFISLLPLALHQPCSPLPQLLFPPPYSPPSFTMNPSQCVLIGITWPNGSLLLSFAHANPPPSWSERKKGKSSICVAWEGCGQLTCLNRFLFITITEQERGWKVKLPRELWHMVLYDL